MKIRETDETDIDDIFEVEKSAFGFEKEAILTKDLLNDETAKPYLSLLAFDDDKPVGHILFTRTGLNPKREEISGCILAPLAVIPDYQNKGVGGELIKHGLKVLEERGVDLVFVLGHPEYYPKFGFAPAGIKGFEAPYPIPEIHAEAWMVQELKPGVIGNASGKVTIAKALDEPEHWRE